MTAGGLLIIILAITSFAEKSLMVSATTVDVIMDGLGIGIMFPHQKISPLNSYS